MRRNTEAWIATGRRTSLSNMMLDEEVIVLEQRTLRGGVVMNGSAVNYEVLRFDGTCVSLMGDEITFRKPPVPPRYAPVQWERLNPAVTSVLVEDGKVRSTVTLAAEQQFLIAFKTWPLARRSASR